MMLNLFHNDDFVFNNPYEFPERQGSQKAFSGEGDFIPVRPGRNMWETNFVPDLAAFELKEWKARGAGGSNMMFVLADGTMHAHISQMPVGTYKKAHRHGPDFHVFAVTGQGYSLLWYDVAKELVRIDWQHGVVFAPPDQMFHQHFNTSPDPARYLAVAFGGLRYPFTASKKHVFMGMDVNVQDGGCQIEYEDQDRRIHDIFLKELAKTGAKSKMGQFIDESGLRQRRRPDRSRSAMHDLEFDHLHYVPDDEVNEVAWATDNVELRTVGIDIGSSTSHLMFSLVHLQRLGTALSSRFVVIKRQVHVAVADQADALPARLHHRHRRPRRVLRRLLPPRAGRSRRRRLRRRHPDRRGDQAAQRARHRRAVLGSVRNLRLRLRRPSHGMPDGGARLRRRRDVARHTATPCSMSTSAAAPPSSPGSRRARSSPPSRSRSAAA